MNTKEQLLWTLRRTAFLEKIGQGGLGSAVSGLATPLLFGLGGYGASKALGGEARTGIPDWLLGPAAGVGLGLPLFNAARQGISGALSRRSNQEQADRQQAEIEASLQQDAEMQQQMQMQAQEMMQRLALSQSGVPMAPPDVMQQAYGGMPMPGMTVTGALRKQGVNEHLFDKQRITKGSRVGIGTGMLLGGLLGTIATHGETKGARRLLGIMGGATGGSYAGRNIGELLAPHLGRKHKKAQFKPRPPTDLSVPAESADQVTQMAAQKMQQQAAMQQQQQMQQAAVAQLIKGQFRGLQGQQRKAMQQPTARR